MSNLNPVIEKKIEVIKSNLQQTWQEISDEELKVALQADLEQLISQIQDRVDVFRSRAELRVQQSKQKVLDEIGKLKKS